MHMNGGGFAFAGQGAGIVANSTFVDNSVQEQGADIALGCRLHNVGEIIFGPISLPMALEAVECMSREAAAANVAYNMCWSSGDECMSFPTTADGGQQPIRRSPLLVVYR